MNEFETPMMQQYRKIKEQHSDCLLFFRLGDFYELFLKDAEIGAKVLNITLTSRDRGKDGRIPMAGVPYHAADSYLAKLVEAGYKVAICEQVSAPNGGILVDREVVRIVTPGTIINDTTLMHSKNNYTVSVSLGDKMLGFAFADLSTGEFFASELEYNHKNIGDLIIQEMSRFSPSECVLNNSLYNDPIFLKYINYDQSINIYPFHTWEIFSSDYATAKKYIEAHFHIKNLHAFSLEGKEFATRASAALLGYLNHTQKNNIKHIRSIKHYSSAKNLELDRATIINLELFSTLREGAKQGTLLDVLDKTKTAMGARLLRKWITRPLYDRTAIEQRYSVIGFFKNQRDLRKSLINDLEGVMDIERLLSKLSIGIGNARDLVNLKNSLKTILTIKKKLVSEELKFISDQLSEHISNVIGVVERIIVDDPPIDLKEGGLIKQGINSKVDALREQLYSGKDWISRLEKLERTRSGINSLKVKYNKVFGYYIEISNSNLSSVPENYLRKQTLVNAERYITPELKEKEEVVINASEELKNIEYEMFLEVVQEVLKSVDFIQDSANGISILDCLLDFSEISEKYNYTKPQLNREGLIDIKDGRHPVIELVVENQQFVPNDVLLDHEANQLLLITGPNMAGKSVYIRQVALLVLMAHIGCFVPAASANICLVDRIFVRSGASDMISRGLSTFMVEMIEAAFILNHTTKDSLIIMDEIGRGTSTFDGISIASAIAEYLVSSDQTGNPKTLFATHYHELQALEKKHKGIKNFQVVVKHENGTPVFLHKVIPGGASHSFGVAVAKMAGIPDSVIMAANSILESYEKGDATVVITPKVEVKSDLETRLAQIDPQKLTPLDALILLSELKSLLK